MTTIAEIAADAGLQAGYPGITATASGLATPQIRVAGTLGGNLLQRNRCWYFRNTHFSCFHTGGEGCPARDGQHTYSSVIDQGPCIAPHPSSMAIALLVHDAEVAVSGRGCIPIAELYGDGSDPARDHLLRSDEVLLAVDLPAPVPNERASYHRAISRHEAEWPLVEAIARATLAGGVIATAAVAAGGVARTPLLLPEVAAALVGRPPEPDVLREAAERATARCAALPGTHYKVGLLRDTVLEVLERVTTVPT